MKKILLTGCALSATILMNAQNCADIFISEYVEGTYNNKAIELYNPTGSPINLEGGQYKMGRDRDGQGQPMLLDITGVIPAYGTRVFVLDKRDPQGEGNEIMVDLELQELADTFVNPVYVQTNSPFYFNGDDAFVLVKGESTILDIVGKIGEDPGEGWYVPGDPFTRWWTTDNTLIRKAEIQHGVLENPDVFDPSLEWDSLPEDTFENLGQHTCVCAADNVTENSSGETFSMFPNPIADGQFVLKSAGEIASFSITSLDGKLVHTQTLAHATFNTNVTLPRAEAGIYMIEVVFANGTKSYRKIIAR